MRQTLSGATNRRLRWALWVPVAALGCAVALPAAAFVRTPTCYDNNPSHPFACREGEIPRPIFWPQMCVPWQLQQDGVSTIPDRDELQALVQLSFDEWEQQDCASWDPQFDGLTPSRAIGVDPSTSENNGNVVLFAETGWPNPPRVQALTSVTYRISTGEIVDADIHVNAQSFEIGVVEEGGASVLDLQNVMVHEIGHFLGLDHTELDSFTGDGDWTQATMFATAGFGDTNKRTVEDDDVNGLCDIYPSRSDASACACEESDGRVVIPDRDCAPVADGEPGEDAGSDGGQGGSDAGTGGDAGGGLVVERRPKSCAAAGPGGAPGVGSALMVLALLGLRRRRGESA